MTVLELLTDLQRQGFILTPLPGGKLEVRPASRLPEELREQLRQRKGEVLALLAQKPAPDYREMYQEMVRHVSADMPFIDSWLADSHPDLWQKIRRLDDALTALEQGQAPEGAYQERLSELITVCREAHGLYLQRRQQARVWVQ